MDFTCKFCGEFDNYVACESCSVEMCEKCEEVLSLELSNGEKGCVECEH